MNSTINILLFFVFIAMLVASFIAINIYVDKLSLEDVKPNLAYDKNTLNLETKDTLENKKTWTEIFTLKNIPSFSYPSSELLISLDFSNEKKTNVLTITNLDSYKFFCLNEVLKNNNIKFSYKKTSDFITLEIALKEDSLREKLKNELKKYNISYNIK